MSIRNGRRVAADGGRSGSGAPTTITPDFIGQLYVDTGGPTAYFAHGLSQGDWTEVAAGSGGSNYPDLWEELAGDEVFSDDFSSFSGWTVYNSNDMTSSPSVDSTASVYRAKGANPCIDATTRDYGIIIMPENNTSNDITISREISGVFDGDGDWTIMSKMNVPNHKAAADNSFVGGMGVSLPASNSIWYNAGLILALDTDSSTLGLQSFRYTDGSAGDITEYNVPTARNPAFPSCVWTFLFHQDGASTIEVFFSTDGGRTLSEVGDIGKDPAAFTHLFFWISASKQAGSTTYHQAELCYTRVYQSLKQR